MSTFYKAPQAFKCKSIKGVGLAARDCSLKQAEASGFRDTFGMNPGFG